MRAWANSWDVAAARPMRHAPIVQATRPKNCRRVSIIVLPPHIQNTVLFFIVTRGSFDRFLKRNQAVVLSAGGLFVGWVCGIGLFLPQIPHMEHTCPGKDDNQHEEWEKGAQGFGDSTHVLEQKQPAGNG